METQRGQGTARPFGWGADKTFDSRPGVPMEWRPPKPLKGAHRYLQPQTARAKMKRGETPHLTPVFGTAQPPSGLSGLMRRFAYRLPQHLARRWLLLIAADKVDVYGHRLAKTGVRLFFGGLATGGVLLLRRLVRD